LWWRERKNEEEEARERERERERERREREGYREIKESDREMERLSIR
jgi:hypothetical protein